MRITEGLPALVLAKTSRPRLCGVAHRERLFQLLDRCREHPATWVCGPPGAGKTTLVASYLEVRQRPALWYQVDAGDADAATFFHYLSQAATAYSRSQSKPWPLGTEHSSDLTGFTRRYFRDLFARLPKAVALVLDDYQEADCPSWHSVISQALAEVPDQIRVIIISRGEPPSELARLQASEKMAIVSREELRLTLDEAQQIAHTRHVMDEAAVHKLHESSDGWAAGFVLMLEHLAQTGAKSGVSEIAARQKVFNYFAGVVFDKAPMQVRRLWLSTAFLPRFTAAMAQRLSGIRDAGKLLQRLSQQHLFTDRREFSEASFQYCALFRDFLLNRVRELYSPAERAQLAHRTARVLDTADQHQDAMALYCQSGDFASASRLILQHAPAWVVQGRAQTIASSIGMLPRGVVETEPWLAYWLGMARTSTDPAAGRALLEQAFARFAETGDALGQLHAACGAIEALYVEWTDFPAFDKWIEPLDRLIPEISRQSPELELRSLSALLTLALSRRPQYPGLSTCIERIAELLKEELDASQKVKTGTLLLNYYFWVGELERGPRIMKLIEPLLARAQPLDQVWAWVWHAFNSTLRADTQEAARGMKQALGTAGQNGLDFLRGALNTFAAYPSLSDGDAETAETFLKRAQPLLDDSRDLDVSFYHLERSWQAALRGDNPGAVHHGQMALDRAVRAQVWGPLASCLTVLAESFAECREHGRAAECLEQARTSIVGLRAPILEYHILLIDAYSSSLKGDGQRCCDALRRALAVGRERGYLATAGSLPKVMARLLGFGLEHGIEVEYAVQVINNRGLLPEVADVPNWPWPVRIYTMGRFAIVRNGAPAPTRGKAPQRPLELLKALIALGGRRVHASTLIAHLWPDTEDGRRTLEITLHRLRGLLGSDAAVEVHEGKLTLGARYCWVDVWALERVLSKLDDESDASLEIERTADQVLRLYAGEFLALEEEKPWMLAARERLRSRFLRHIRRLGQHWERADRWDKAMALYQRGLEVDPLAEELYRRLMLCHSARAHRAEAIEVYRRCRHVLSVLLGIDPSNDTQAIYQSLLHG